MMGRDLAKWVCLGCGFREEGDPLIPRCPRCGSPLFLDLCLSKSELSRILEVAKEHRDRGVGCWSPLLHVDEIITLGEGWTPLIKLRRYSLPVTIDVWVKNECSNPTYTFIDRGAAVEVSRAIAKGFRFIRIVGLGDFAVSLSSYARFAGLEAEAVLPRDTGLQHLVRIVVSGTKVKLVDSYERALSVAMDSRGSYTSIPPSGSVAQGYKTISYEIVAQLGFVPDVIFVPAGDGVLASSIYAGFLDISKALDTDLPRIVVVQHGYAPAIVEAVGGALVRDSEDRSLREVSIRKPQALASVVEAIRRSGGTAISVSSSDVLRACTALAKSLGIFVDPVGAIALAGVRRAIELGLLDRREKVVVVLSGCPSKDPLLLYRVAISDSDVARSLRELIGVEGELSASQLDILSVLAEEGPMNLSSLWRALRKRGKRISLSTVHHHLKVLCNMGLVEQVPAGTAISHLYSITERGLALLKRYSPLVER